jgi:hypothetical protein
MPVPAREPERSAGIRAKTAAAGRRPADRRSGAAVALALQRAVGNRAAARLLARWTKHPDQQKKGVMVPDVVASDYDRFNPPKNE